MSAEAANSQQPTPRYDARYSHISVGLRFCGPDAHWHPLRALGWNARGFHFYCAQALDLGPMQFKRGLTPFEGHLVWCARNNDPGDMRAMLVNELLFRKIREILNQPALYTRLVKLLRAPLLTDEKCQVLASLGVDTSDATLARLLAHRPLEQTMFRYGVRVASDIWTELVSNALSMSEVVLALEKMAEALPSGQAISFG